MRIRIQLSRSTVKALQRRLQEAYQHDDVRLVRRIPALLTHLVNGTPVVVLSEQWGFTPACFYEWLMSFLLYIAVVLSVIIAPTVPVILFSHVIDGVAYSFFAVASVLFIAEVAPDRQVTTMMAIFTVTLPSIVRMVSGPVSGWVFDARGAYALYAIGVIGSAVGWVIMKGMVKDRR
jgi:MFS family permease